MSLTTFLFALVLAGLAYLVGSLSTAILTCKAMGLPDPRSAGSGNPGATNVLRIGGKVPAALTLLGDVLKGLIPVLLVRGVSQDAPTLALVGLAAVIGHIYPLYYDFKGGKGVATAFGAVFGLAFPVGLLAFATWLAVSLLTRISSLAAIVTWLAVPLYFLMRGQSVYVVFALVLATLLIYTHRGNISRLKAGTEPRIGQKA